MADKRLHELTNATTLVGNEPLHGEQPAGTSGLDVNVTPAQIYTYVASVLGVSAASGVLYLQPYAGKVAVGATAPVWQLELNRDSNSGSSDTAPYIAARNVKAAIGNNTTTFNVAGFIATAGNNTVRGDFIATYTTDFTGVAIGSVSDSPFALMTNSVRRVYLDDRGNVGIGTGTFATNSSKALVFVNGIPPDSAPADGCALYSEGGSLKLRRANGTVGTVQIV